MRVFVFVLLLLVAAKVGIQQYLASTTKDEIIVAAYRDRAVAACRNAARNTLLELSNSWTPPREMRVVIGKGTLDVGLWQIDNALWQTRYKTPYLVFPIVDAPTPIYCQFNIAQGAASLIRL
jgi:hypothetical protein